MNTKDRIKETEEEKLDNICFCQYFKRTLSAKRVLKISNSQLKENRFSPYVYVLSIAIGLEYLKLVNNT